jgi:hypothetical protein
VWKNGKRKRKKMKERGGDKREMEKKGGGVLDRFIALHIFFFLLFFSFLIKAKV